MYIFKNYFVSEDVEHELKRLQSSILFTNQSNVCQAVSGSIQSLVKVYTIDCGHLLKFTHLYIIS